MVLTEILLFDTQSQSSLEVKPKYRKSPLGFTFWDNFDVDTESTTNFLWQPAYTTPELSSLRNWVTFMLGNKCLLPWEVGEYIISTTLCEKMSREVLSLKSEDSENDTSGAQFRWNQGREAVITAITLHHSFYCGSCKGMFVPVEPRRRSKL